MYLRQDVLCVLVIQQRKSSKRYTEGRRVCPPRTGHLSPLHSETRDVQWSVPVSRPNCCSRSSQHPADTCTCRVHRLLLLCVPSGAVALQSHWSDSIIDLGKKETVQYAL